MSESGNMMQWRIREAVPADVPNILAIERQAFSISWNEESILGWIRGENRCYYLAEEAEFGVLLGYLGVFFVAGEGEIASVAVGAPFRKYGVGKSLFRHLKGICRRDRVGSLFLEVREKNVPALALYESEGFERVGFRRGYYPDTGEGAVLMKTFIHP